MNQESSTEFDAFKTVHDALAPLSEEARSRIVKSVITLLAIDAPALVAGAGEGTSDAAVEVSEDKAAQAPKTYASFAALYAAADPGTNADRALVAGYWLQVCEMGGSFTGQAANKGLTQLGHKVANITSAIDQLRTVKPALVLQLKKSGSSKQARKVYQLSEAGIQRVEEMFGG